MAMRKLLLVVVSIASVALSLVQASPASAATTSEIRSSYSNRCLDADLNTIGGNGTKVQLWDCNGQPQQKWVRTGEFGTTLRNVYSNRCLDADLNTIGGNGTKIQLWDCNGQNQQKWWLVQRASYKTIDSNFFGKTLDADLNTIGGNGTKVQLWQPNYQLQQRWSW